MALDGQQREAQLSAALQAKDSELSCKDSELSCKDAELQKAKQTIERLKEFLVGRRSVCPAAEPRPHRRHACPSSQLNPASLRAGTV
jgi:hypothetical protein